MPSTYTNDLRLELIAVGEGSGSAPNDWGSKTNVNLTSIAGALGAGIEQMASDADATITMVDGAADEFRSLFLKITSAGSLTATRTLTFAPNTISKLWIVENATTGSQSITISQGSGANVTIENGKSKIIYTDGAGSGAAVVDALLDLDIGGTFTVGTAATGVSISSGAIDLKNSGAVSNVKFYCESSNAHYVEVKSPPHSSYSGNVNFTLPPTNGTAGQFLKVDGSGVTSWASGVTIDANGVVKFDNGIQEESTAVTSSSNAATLNLQDGTVFTHTLTENVTYTFSNPAASGYASGFTLKVTQDSSARTITWPGSVDWAGGTAPTLSTGSGDVDVFCFLTTDGGTKFYGFVAAQDLS